MANALILGGAGFVGYHVAERLSAAQPGSRITLVDNFARGALDHDLERLLAARAHIQLQQADLTDVASFQQFSQYYDHVYLLAGMIGARNVQNQPAAVVRINTAIIMNTLEWLAGVGCGRLLFASTSEVYAGSVELGIGSVPSSETIPVAVRDVQHPRCTYALTKMLGEAAVTHYAKAYGFSAMVVRLHNIYGPRMGFDHVIPELIDRIYQRMDPLPVYGLEQTRAFCYVTDAVDACIALMQCSLEACEIVHVGNAAEEVTVEHLLQKLLALAGTAPTIERLPAFDGAVSRRCPQTDKLHRLTGFRASVGLDEGLACTRDWYLRMLDARQQQAEPTATIAGGPH